MKRLEPTKEKAKTLVSVLLNKKKQKKNSLPSKFCPRDVQRAVVLDNSGKDEREEKKAERIRRNRKNFG
ncbi:hypothetical protein RIR_jg25109.t1 [Rhizophagus irregularis DAOM 181602=DAOM 197198]|nr:hypothetical protein RIR_jg25109.t1 [Rhizophagus irregularis DAOM 181602=DAOM 197198]